MSKHRRPTHGSRRAGLAAAALGVAVLTTLGASAPAMAAKGGGGGGKPASGGSSTGSSISVVLLDSTDGAAHYGQRVTFNVSTGATTQPLVSLKCNQDGVLVYSGQTGFYDGYPWPWTQVQTLTSTAWTGGAADCVATLYRYTGKGYQDLATTSFGVLA